MMNRRTLIGTVALGLSAFVAAAFAGDDDKNKNKDGMTGAKLGEAAPAWTATDITGKEWKSTDFAGKIVVMDWVNPQCPVCKGAHADKRIPNMITELKGMENVVFLAVNSTHNTDAQANKDALTGYGVEYPVLLDTAGTIGKAYGAKTTPHVFVVDDKGILRYNGALDDDKTGNNTKDGKPVTNYAINAVKQIKAGETVTPDSSQPYGCSVKYGKAGSNAGGNKPSGH